MTQFEKLNSRMCRYSLGYAMTRNFLVRPIFMLFYRKIQVVGAHNVPKKGPVIFTPNHQNALMDAICILCTRNRQPVFVARADIFRSNSLIVKILHFLRILPIYRKRDGVNTSDNNKETFDILLNVLHHGHAIGIMPEGVHNDRKRLGNLQKGVFRFAMQAQDDLGAAEAVKIVPVGLEYSDVRRFRSDVIIRYGVPLDMCDYLDLYKNNPAKAFRKLQDTLSERMKEGMINIETVDEADYDAVNWARSAYETPVRRQLNLAPDGQGRLTAQQTVIAALEHTVKQSPDTMGKLTNDISEYRKLTAIYNIPRPEELDKPWSVVRFVFHSLLLLLTWPFFLFGMACNYLPFRLCLWATKKLKDPQFNSSVKYVAALVFFPIYHLLIAVLFLIFAPTLAAKLALILLIVPSALWAFSWYAALQHIQEHFLTRTVATDNPRIKEEICSLHRRIDDTVDDIVKSFFSPIGQHFP